MDVTAGVLSMPPLQDDDREVADSTAVEDGFDLPSSLNVYDAWLPYASHMAATPDVTLRDVNAGLRAFVQSEEEVDGSGGGKEGEEDREETKNEDEVEGGSWSSRGIGPHMKKLATMVTLKLKFGREELGEYLLLAYRLMLSKRLGRRSQVRGRDEGGGGRGKEGMGSWWGWGFSRRP